MALEREQLEELPPRSRAPFSTPITPFPDTDETRLGAFPDSHETALETFPDTDETQPGPFPDTSGSTTGQILSLPTGKRRIPLRLWLPAVLLLILVVLGTVAYAVDAIWLVARATVTIVPANNTISQSIPVDAVLMPPTAAQAKVIAYTASSPRQSVTHPTSGAGHQLAVQSTGVLWFYSIANYKITIPQGTRFTGSDGVVVMTDAPAYVPAGNPPQQVGNTFVSAHAQLAGASGNIGALDVNIALQGNDNGIEVKNQAAFSGGLDEKTYPAVSQADITSAAAPLETTLTQAAQAALQAKLGPGEQFLTQASCTSNVQADPTAGKAGTTVQVSVQITCQRDAYNRQQVMALAASRFTEQATAELGSSYAAAGPPTTAAAIQVTKADVGKGQFTLTVPLRGRFVYQFNQQQLKGLPGLLAGKSSSTASALLLNTPGVARASIQLTGLNNGALPTDITQIRVIIATPHSA